MSEISREAYKDYKEALDDFAKIRKEMNDLINKGDLEGAKQTFQALKYYAAGGETVAMDLLAYYYKSGINGVVKENYSRYIEWEVLAAARGNELAIEKLQFLIGYACDEIMEDEEYDLIEYKNDIDESNALYVIGKNLCKIIAREKMKVYPGYLIEKEDEFEPYKKETFINFRKMIDESVERTKQVMKS